MANTEHCRLLHNVYLQHVDDMGKAVPQLFTARRVIENFKIQIADILQKIRLEQASTAAGRAAAGRTGAYGIIPSIAFAVNSAQNIARLERDLKLTRVQLEEAKTLVRTLERAITGYQWGIDNTPKEMAQDGCDPV